jgi:hypothetical protein
MPGIEVSPTTVPGVLALATQVQGADMGSVAEAVNRVAGTSSFANINCNVNNGTQSLNCFAVSGAVRILKLYAFIMMGTFTNCTAAFFELDDGAAQVPITLNNGVLSGMGQGTVITRQADASVTMDIMNPVAGAVSEPAGDQALFKEFAVLSKTGQPTNIRFTYTSTDTPANVQIAVAVDWVPIGQGSNLFPAMP